MRKNKIFSSLLAAAVLSTFAVSAQASSVSLDAPVSKTNWEVSGSLAHYSIDASSLVGKTINGDVLQASFSYAVRNPEGHFSLVPELTLGKGVNGDSAAGVEFDVDTVLQIGTRFVLHPTDIFDVYLNPTYRKVSLDFTDGYGHGSTSSDWAFGVGVGVGANITNDLNLSLTFDRTKLDFDGDEFDTDVVTGKVSYRF